MTLGHAGFRSRRIQPSDLVICSECGGNLGERRAFRPDANGVLDDELIEIRVAEHEPECKRRTAHQRLHRSLDGPCEQCRGVEAH